MARAVVEEFPILKDDEGHGFEAWYTPGKGIHSATGWLEERLRNVRRRSSNHSPMTKISTCTSSNMITVTALPGKYPIFIFY